MIAGFRPFHTLAMALLLAACASGAELGDERVELGDFHLGHNIVVAQNAQMGPLSRRASAEEWEEVLRNEVDRRFSRYEGTRLYHIALMVDGYVLAVPGVPLVASPKSALIIRVNIWDDALGGKLNEEPHQITVLESLSGETLVSSGLTQSREVQMQNLAQNAVAAVERWMSRHPEWFSTGAGTAQPVEEDSDTDPLPVDDEADPAAQADELADASTDA